MNLRNHYLDLVDAASYSVSSPRRAASTVAVGVIAFLLFVLGSFPEYSYQMFNSQASMFTAVNALVWNIQATAGYLGLLLTVVYSAAVGVATTDLYAIISNTGIRQVSSLGGALPGFLVGSCAGCGAGILGLIGFAGAVTLLPFNGNIVKLAGIAFVVYFLVDIGHPETCGVSPAS
ncbi:MAG: hypothetical protein ABEJ64_03005 [Candidatus Nanohaloarchaea archaeon]